MNVNGSYKLLVDVPVKNGSRMALPRGAIKVDLVPDLILGLHPCYLGVVFRQCYNETERQREINRSSRNLGKVTENSLELTLNLVGLKYPVSNRPGIIYC